MFGLGMNNNGAGLVLASMALAHHPQVLLPIILYNLVQHLVAGFVDVFSRRRHLADRAVAYVGDEEEVGRRGRGGDSPCQHSQSSQKHITPRRKPADFPLVLAYVNRQPTGVGSKADLSARPQRSLLVRLPPPQATR